MHSNFDVMPVTDNDQSDQDIVNVQRKIRSKLRASLHLRLFNENPVSNWSELSIPSNQSELRSRLNAIIANITIHQKIINGQRLYHHTTLPNLQSIVTHGYFYGNDVLKSHKINFQKNTYSPTSDGKNGDAKILCLCPGQVDMRAYALNGTIKPDRCILTLDISHLSRREKYNEFFKLSDLNAGWEGRFIFGDLSFVILNTKHEEINVISINVSFKNKHSSSVVIDKNNMIFYGNIFSINRFCAIQLFNIINKIENTQLKGKIFSYLNTLDDNELKKLIITFSQTLTHFAEYNFDSVMPLNEIRIKEILMLGDKKIKYDFSDLSESDYNDMLSVFFDPSSYRKNLDKYAKIVSNKDTIYADHVRASTSIFISIFEHFQNKKVFNCINIFGSMKKMTPIGYVSTYIDVGYIYADQIPTALFDTDQYVESRVGVSGNSTSRCTTVDGLPNGYSVIENDEEKKRIPIKKWGPEDDERFEKMLKSMTAYHLPAKEKVKSLLNNNSHLLFASLEKSFLIENRHANEKIQSMYDRRYGLTVHR